MIKFNCLIHKETGTVIKYEEWKEKLEKEHPIKCTNKSRRNLWSYQPKDVLFNGDFEIIYDSEFTLQELANIFSKDISKELESKILNESMKKAVLKEKYGIEV